MKYILTYWYICNTCLSLNLSQAFTRPIFFICASPKDGGFFNRGCTFFSSKKPTSTLLYFYLNFGERDWKVHFSALEFLIFWLVDKIVINYTCPVDKFIMLLVKMGFLGILAQRRRHLKVFTRDVNVYTKWKEKITFDNREAH